MTAKRLLLIDDSEDHTELIKYAFECQTNWEILTASNGAEGIAQAKLQLPDVILLDVILPDLNEVDVCKILKSNIFTCTIPVILLTVMSQHEVCSQFKTALAQGIITKPFDPVNLVSSIVKICEWQSIAHL